MDFNSILKDLEKDLVWAESREKDITVVSMRPGANEFIEGFWGRAILAIADKWWGKALIMLGLGYLLKILFL